MTGRRLQLWQQHPLMIGVFSGVWYRWLVDDWTGRPYRVRFVTGWRSCLYDSARWAITAWIAPRVFIMEWLISLTR